MNPKKLKGGFNQRKMADKVDERDLRVSERFTVVFLEDIYSESIKLARLRRALKRVKQALRRVLSILVIPENLEELT